MRIMYNNKKHKEVESVADTFKKMKIVIIVLSILLGLSLIALAGVIICGQTEPAEGSDVVTDNYIEPGACSSTIRYLTMPVMLCASVPNVNLSRSVPAAALSKTVITSDSAKETVISIYKTHAGDSTPFHSPNMFPGDSGTKAYFVEVSHKGTVTVRFHANIRAGYEKLAEVLKCRIVLREENELLYDGLMRDMPDSINHNITSVFSKTTGLTYDITVYLDTGVGNEYMNKELVADFCWWVEESGGDPTSPSQDPGETTDPDDKTDQDDGELVYPPQTGDNSHFCIWFWIAMISLLINIILLWPKRRRNNGEQEDVTANEQ